MISKRRVVITGLGVISPVGIGVDENWSSIIAAHSGISRVTHFDPTNYPSQIAGEIKDFDPTRSISEKEARRMDRFIQVGVATGIEALRDSGIEVMEANAERIGVHIGSGIGGAQTIEETALIIKDRRPRVLK